jgi:hypothetical protein
VVNNDRTRWRLVKAQRVAPMTRRRGRQEVSGASRCDQCSKKQGHGVFWPLARHRCSPNQLLVTVEIRPRRLELAISRHWAPRWPRITLSRCGPGRPPLHSDARKRIQTSRHHRHHPTYRLHRLRLAAVDRNRWSRSVGMSGHELGICTRPQLWSAIPVSGCMTSSGHRGLGPL